ncbi:hypothetical protein H0H93_015290 [Arthromyces matolae]|nr:hypothetical protein H0H93_015290 [Arthromyces matolae]
MAEEAFLEPTHRASSLINIKEPVYLKLRLTAVCNQSMETKGEMNLLISAASLADLKIAPTAPWI